MVRDLWPLVVAIIIALLATIEPYAKVRSAQSFPITVPFQEVDLSHWDFQSIKLDDYWRWYPAQFISPENSSNLGTQLRLVQLPHYSLPHYSSQAGNNKSVASGSYRLRLKLPPVSYQKQLRLNLNNVCNSAKVYFYPLGEGAGTQAIIEVGNASLKAAEHKAELGRFFASLDLTPGKNHYELIIQSAGHSSPTPGLCQAPILGLSKNLQRIEQQQTLNKGFIVAIILSFGLYAIGTSISGSRNRSYLWLGSAAVLVALSKAALEGIVPSSSQASADAAYRFAANLQYSTILLGGALFVGFIHHSFKVHFLSNQFINRNLIVAIIVSLPFFILQAEYSRELISIIIIYSFAQYFLALYLLYKVLSNRLMYARRVALYISPLLVAVPLELAEYLGLIKESPLFIATIIFLVVAQGLTQSQKLARASKVASRLSQGLGDAVQKRTSDLHFKNQELLQAQQELTRANQELRALSVTDGLTSVFNRMYFDRQFIAEWQRSRRDQKNLCLMLIDVDHFKKINDKYGHSAGDDILRSIAQTLLDHFKRGSDIICRYGGEEFTIILSDCSLEQAADLAEQLRVDVAASQLRYHGESLDITVSIGVCGLTPGPDHQPLDLLNATDQALYQAKRSGRNCVRQAPPPAPTAKQT